uniref:ATP synthase subunit b, chloroplastic n=1 Tax=Mesotaenium endlicherianum TaxID=184485 RepID=A0A024B4W6_9VIRI|nr:CF0 subunit I of ATP synthase [Mesotaenium endlicherianum]AHZ11246.1 CF0 subunit I of ATP synthase [Mesotaenium endlicherianum]
MNSTSGLMMPLSWKCLAAGFGLNTNLLDTNLFNLAVVIGVLVYFGRGVLTTLLDNRRDEILNTIQNAEKRYQETIEQLQQKRAFLQQAQAEAEEIRLNGFSQRERAKQELIEEAAEKSKRLDDYKNATLCLNEQRIIEELRQEASRSALKEALDALSTRLHGSVQTQMIDYHISLLKTMQSQAD